MHLRDEDIAKLIYPGLVDAAGSLSREHAAECVQCGERVRLALDADRGAGALLALIDHPVPKVDVGALLAARRRSRAIPFQKVAAGIGIFLVTATVALALPGSPLQRMLKNIVTRFSASPESPTSIREPTTLRGSSAAASSASSHSAIALVPDTVLEIVFRYPQRAGEIRIGFTDGTSVSLASSDASAAFDVQPARITVSNVKSNADYELSLPPALGRVTVTVGARIVFQLDHGAVITPSRRNGVGHGVTIPFRGMGTGGSAK